MAFDIRDILGPLGGFGDLIDYIGSGGNPASGRNNLVKQLSDAAVLDAANIGVATDNAITATGRGLERAATGVSNLFRETPTEPVLRPYRDYYTYSDLDQNKINPWDVINGTATAAPFMKPVGNLLKSGARAIEGSARPVIFEDAATQAAKANVENAMQNASNKGLLAEIPHRPTMTNAEFAEAAYRGQPADAFNPAAWTGRPTMEVPINDYVGQNVARLEAEAANKSIAPQAQILAKDIRTVANPSYVTLDPLSTPNVDYFTSEALRDAALKESIYDPTKAVISLLGGSKTAEGIATMLDPNNLNNVSANEEAQFTEDLANRINSSNTAQQNTESAGGSQTSSQPVPTYDVFARRPAPLIPEDPTQPNLFINRTERPSDFNVVSNMNPTNLRDWYLKQTNGALDIGPIFNIVKDLPDDFSKYEAAKAALTEAVNNAGLEANDSWLSTIGWLITIPFAIRRGMSPDEVWEKIVNSRIAINPQVRQAQTALENIEALRNARLELLSKVNPLIAYAIQGTSNPELAEARVVNALANAQQAIARGNLYNAQTEKTETFNNAINSIFGQGTSGQGTPTQTNKNNNSWLVNKTANATAKLNSLSNK